MTELEPIINAIKDPDLRLALQVFATVMSRQHEDNKTTLARIQDSYLDAFPDKDVHGHKAAHIVWIKREEKEAQFWDGLKAKLAAAGAVGTGGIVLTALAYYIIKVIVEHIPK